MEAEERRNKNNQFIKEQGIACYENLPLCESSKEVKLKSLEEIAKRAIACILTIQIVYDIQNDDYENSVNIIKKLLKEYKVDDKLNSKEKRLIEGSYTEQDLIDMDWAYEAVWSLLWALGLVEDIRNGGELCDCEYVISLIQNNKNIEEFIEKCKLKNINEILDMLDLYYRYDWAVTEKRINPSTNIGNLNSSNVTERRRGLEWLISDEDDWYEIEMNT